MDDLEKAKDKIMMGAERRSMVMTEDEKKLTAYHEAGHAIVGRLCRHDPVYKVTSFRAGAPWVSPCSCPRRTVTATARSLKARSAACSAAVSPRN